MCRSSTGKLNRIWEVATMLCTTGRGIPFFSSLNDGDASELYFRLRIMFLKRGTAESPHEKNEPFLEPCDEHLEYKPGLPRKDENINMSDPFCTLCGINLMGMKRRLFCPVEGRKFIEQKCKQSPFLYERLTRGNDLPSDKNSFLCIPCVNWKRRAEQGSLRRAIRPMLQLDLLLLYLMQPGKHQEPDRRCMERLVKAARQDSNPYRAIFPFPVQQIVQRIKGDTYHHCVLAWWEFNGKTEFFASAQEARRVRCALKAC